MSASKPVDDTGSPVRGTGSAMPTDPATVSAMLDAGRNTWDHQSRYEGLFCPQPFEFAQVNLRGQMFACCPQQLPTSVGDLNHDDLMDAWNSGPATEIRAAILDGSFKFCNAEACGALQTRNLPRVTDLAPESPHGQIVARRTTRLDHGPRTINLSYDPSCNLACPSCRTHPITASGKEREILQAIHDHTTSGQLRDARRLVITGSGDPFGSRLYLSFLETFDPATNPDLRIQLSTNGLLLTPRMWQNICHDAIDSVDVSVDASTPETFAINRGGDFSQLLENLRFIGSLRQDGSLANFELHFVVQENNFAEMFDFVRLGLKVHCDTICFKQLLNWGTFSPSEYRRRAIQFPDHPRHAEFLQVLQDPFFRQANHRVYLHDLTALASGT